MTEDLDFYDLLDIPSDASQDDVKQAFREQVRVYHPDLNDDDRARAQFTALKKAYDILGDPVERQAYDRLGHADYVAKRTSGLPSPDVWRSSTDESSTSERAERSSADGSSSRSEATKSRSTATGSQSGTASASAATSRERRSSREAAGGGVGARASTATAGERTGTSSGPTHDTGDVGTRTARDRPSGSGAGVSGNAVARWWHRRNFAWPLIWLSILTYVAGLLQFGLENASPLEGVANDLVAAGGEPAGLWEALSADRADLESIGAFLAGAEPVAPPLAQPEWYGVLAGIVTLPVIGLLAVRVGRREDAWGPVSIDETLVLALALGASATLLAGPLLAGVVLMPLLFGVVVHRTRQLPGWSPSYLYVCAVLAPAVALAAAAGGHASTPTDLLAFAVLPLAGAFGLPLRVAVRKRFGR